MKSMVVAAVIVSALFSFSTAAFAYETIEVKNGGSIEGVAEFTGAAVPKDKTVTLSSETAYCGKTMPAETYLIKDKKIKNVVVYIEEVKAGKAFPAEPVTLTNLKCAFEPHVAVGFKGSKFVERNDDTIFHNIHTYLNGKTMYNIGLPEKGASVTKPLTKTGLIEVTCDSHPWMHGYVYVSENPYAAVTDDKGSFTIDNIPPGTYAVEAWHEALGKVKLTNVKVESGKAVRVRMEFKK